jgi:hypothetical protein
MARDNTATDGLEVLKRQLASGEYRSSVDVILASAGWILQKVARRPKPPRSWVCALAIALLISLIAYLSSLLTGGVPPYGYRTIASGGVLIFVSLVIARTAFARVFATLHDELLDGLESSAGLTGLRDWLASVGDFKRPALIGLVIYAAYVTFLVPDPTASTADIIVMGGVLLLWTGFVTYYMYLFAVLTLRLGRCQFQLHTEDPVSTEVLADWSRMMNFAAYIFAVSQALGTLFTVTLVTFTSRTLAFVIPRWLPLIALFAVNQIAISGVIRRSKRKSLNEVEAQMAVLRPREDPPDNETLETLLWLWDYHDRIKGTRNTMLNLKEIVNFVNTLLIPLVAFLIANREALFELLGWST